MTENTKPRPIRIDLNQFKLNIDLKNKIQLTLHFNSPSRKFYLSVIALVVNEMKRLGKITSIPINGHHDLLALLNETIGGTAGSSEKENLLPRIYRKWKNALPNLEEAPLFKVLGRKKEYGEGNGKAYPFSEAEKDSWANLFEYKGSEANVRLKFAIDKIGASLDDVDILYGDSVNGDAWEKFVSGLKEKGRAESEREDVDEVHKDPATPLSLQRESGKVRPSRYRLAALIAVSGLVVGASAIGIRGLYIRHAPPSEVAPKEKITSLQHEKSLPITPPSTGVPAREKGNVEVRPEEGGESRSPGKVSKPVTSASPYRSETGRGTTNLEAYLKSMEARDQILRYSKEGNARAKRLFEEVIALDQNYARGYSGLALCHAADVWLGTSNSSNESLARAIELGQKALSLDETDAYNHAVLAYLFAMTRQYDKGIARAERALALDPNSISVIRLCGLALMYSGRAEEAVPLFQEAMRLNPSFPPTFLELSTAYRLAGRYEEALKWARKAVERDPENLRAQLALTMACILSGREAEARVTAQKVLKINPDFSVERFRTSLLFKDKFQVDLNTDALRKAGLN